MNKLKRFLSYYKPHRGLLILDLSCAFLVAAIDIAYPLLTQYVLRKLLAEMAINNALFRSFVILIVAALGAYLVRALLLFIINYWGHVLGIRMEADIRRDIFSHIQELSFSFFDKARTGKLMSRVTTGPFRHHRARAPRPGGCADFRHDRDRRVHCHGVYRLAAGAGAVLHCAARDLLRG
jgi:ATP-binding cassette subfamily B protein